MEMACVQTLDELKENLHTLDTYLDRKAEPYYSYAVDRIKKGVCFMAVKTEDGFRFYPSRFIGYRHNSMEAHENNEWKDGKETTPTITHILGHKPCPDAELEHAYQAYCETLGFTANPKGAYGVERKFWRF